MECPDIAHIDRDLHDVSHRGAVRLHNLANVLEHLFRLGTYIALADQLPVGVQGHLTSNKQERTRVDADTVRVMRLQRLEYACWVHRDTASAHCSSCCD